MLAGGVRAAPLPAKVMVENEPAPRLTGHQRHWVPIASIAALLLQSRFSIASALKIVRQIHANTHGIASPFALDHGSGAE